MAKQLQLGWPGNTLVPSSKTSRVLWLILSLSFYWLNVAGECELSVRCEMTGEVLEKYRAGSHLYHCCDVAADLKGGGCGVDSAVQTPRLNDELLSLKHAFARCKGDRGRFRSSPFFQPLVLRSRSRRRNLPSHPKVIFTLSREGSDL